MSSRQPLCGEDGCHARAWNFCGACGKPSCNDHAVADDHYEEGYVCPGCSQESKAADPDETDPTGDATELAPNAPTDEV